jgi:hypothetical protein
MLHIILINVILINVNVLSVILIHVIVLSVILITVILIRVTVLSVILMIVILLSATTLTAIVTSHTVENGICAIVLFVIMLNVVKVTVMAPYSPLSPLSSISSIVSEGKIWSLVSEQIMCVNILFIIESFCGHSISIGRHDIQHHDTQLKGISCDTQNTYMTLSITSDSEWHNTESRYAVCHVSLLLR